jgi:hypothetical protein
MTLPDRPFEKQTSGVRAEEICSDVFRNRGLGSHSVEGATETLMPQRIVQTLPDSTVPTLSRGALGRDFLG